MQDILEGISIKKEPTIFTKKRIDDILVKINGIWDVKKIKSKNGNILVSDLNLPIQYLSKSKLVDKKQLLI